MSSTDQALVALARSQHAVFTGRQAVERGVTRKVLRGRLASGWLTRIDHDVFHVAGTTVTWEAKVLAVQLAAGPGAVASHRTAAALWGLEGFGRGTPEVTVPRGVRFRRDGVRVHSSTDLQLAGRRVRSGIEVTDPARTVLDLARRLGDARLLEAIESARRQRLTSWSELLATLAKHARRGRPGIRRLRRVIAANIQQHEATDSNLELLMLVLLREHGLPEPVLHHRLLDAHGRLIAEVDLAFPGLRLAIELDGSVHRERAVFERDRPRQNGIVLQGWTLLRFTWRDVVDRPDEVVAAVRSAIALAERRR
jgi:very-short-patch-repair endonuclease